jgi:hypothetical protein
MPADEQEPLTVSREDLYELVWSKPMRDLAKDFGISDVALGKRCRRLAVPVPGRGYWARVDAGQQPYRPKLPKRESQSFDDRALAVGSSGVTCADDIIAAHIGGSEGSDGGLSTAQADEAWLQDRLAYEEHPDNAITLPSSTRKWDESIHRIREDLEEAARKLRISKTAAEKFEKLPDWRRRAHIDTEGWAWRSVRDRGQRLLHTHKPVCFRVSLGTYERALLIANALALAAPARGFKVHEGEKEGQIVIDGHNAEVQIRVTEPLTPKTRPRTGYDGKIEQVKYFIPTGRLRITLHRGYSQGPAFEDRESRPLESQLERVFCGIYRQVIKAWREDRKRQTFQRELEEEARQRSEAAKSRVEREKAIAEARALRRRLSAEAYRWSQSIRIRDYVDHIRTSAAEELNSSAELREWTAWALSLATDMDPTDARLGRATKELRVKPEE